jgi:hypothetical protein
MPSLKALEKKDTDPAVVAVRVAVVVVQVAVDIAKAAAVVAVRVAVDIAKAAAVVVQAADFVQVARVAPVADASGPAGKFAAFV